MEWGPNLKWSLCKLGQNTHFCFKEQKSSYIWKNFKNENILYNLILFLTIHDKNMLNLYILLECRLYNKERGNGLKMKNNCNYNLVGLSTLKSLYEWYHHDLFQLQFVPVSHCLWAKRPGVTYFAKPGGSIYRQKCQSTLQEVENKKPAGLTGWHHNAQVWEMCVLRKGKPSTKFQHSRELFNTLAKLTISKQ